jgi:hypothetical protein
MLFAYVLAHCRIPKNRGVVVLNGMVFMIKRHSGSYMVQTCVHIVDAIIIKNTIKRIIYCPFNDNL